MERDKAKSRTGAGAAPRTEWSRGHHGQKPSRSGTDRMAGRCGVCRPGEVRDGPGPIKSSARRKARADLSLARFPTSQEGLTEAN